MADRRCPACGAPAPGRFCAQCGAPAGGTPESRPGVPPAIWAAGGFVVLALVVLLWTARQQRAPAPLARAAAAEAPFASGGSGGTPPNLSTMSPRERFDRLYRRVMQAAERGDTATVARFSPMAFMAYGQLDSADADARYHAAVLHLHVRGDTAAALRLADTILAAAPHHLFGYLIRGTAARLAGNAPLLERAYADFLAAWDGEMRAARPEYRDHEAMLKQFHEAAVEGRKEGKSEGRKDRRSDG